MYSAGGTFAIYSLLCRKIGITPFVERQSTQCSSEPEGRGAGIRVDTAERPVKEEKERMKDSSKKSR